MQARIIVGTEASKQDPLILHLPLSENKKRYPALDGLRAISVLMVSRRIRSIDVRHYARTRFLLKDLWL